jgi:uncharacterized protein YecE (DUF72 family)
VSGRLLVGASGFSYASWKPGWYPADAKPAEFLRLYAERLPTVELNTTKYRLPGEEQFERWAAQTPPDFSFAVKMPPRGLEAIATFEERVRLLGTRLGPIRAVLVRARDEGYLELFLGSIDPSLRYALDLRHPTWDGVEPRLAEAGVVRVDDVSAPASFRYLRFRDPPYDGAALEAIAARVRERLELGEDVYCYFRHEDEPTAPRYAERLLELVDVGESGRGS